ncbi:MAG TPA: PDZ domain-containing protein [Planctomycetota bacterium]|nr:PDZ domain-containing protein [Planctomycetota bacterium]
MRSNRVLHLLWVVAVLVGGWTLYRFVDFVRQKNRYLAPLSEREVRDPLKEKGSASKARVAKNWPDYRNLFELDVIGRPPPAPPSEDIGPPIPPEPPVRPVSDLLRVLSVMFDAGDPAGTREFDLAEFTGHFCYVQYKDPQLEKSAEPLLSVGDRLPDPHGAILVKAIHPDRVVFQRIGGEDEEVPVREAEIAPELLQAVVGAGAGPAASLPASAPSSRPAIRASRDWPTTTVEERPNKFKVSASDVEEVTERANEIVGTGEITVTPHYRKGESSASGLRIGSIKPGSILDGKGLKPGDVIKAINGTPIRSREQAIEYAQSHPDLRTFTLEIERLGRPLTLTYSLPR